MSDEKRTLDELTAALKRAIAKTDEIYAKRREADHAATALHNQHSDARKEVAAAKKALDEWLERQEGMR